MQATVEGLAEVTKVASSFRFVVSDLSVSQGSARRELARFNNYMVQQSADVAKLKGNIRSLKGSCERVKALRDSLDSQAKKGEHGTMFLLFGFRLGAQARTLHGHVSNLYADDQRMIEQFQAMLKLVTKAINDINDALGPSGMASPYQLPRAAALLGTYAMLLKEPQQALDTLADDLQAARDVLTK